MSSVNWAVIIIVFLASACTVTQDQLCLKDDDCMENQYCQPTSNKCIIALVNCTKSYHRKEASQPSKNASECGDCIKGYSPKGTPQSNSESAICVADNPDWSNLPMIVQIYAENLFPVIFICVLIFSIIVWYIGFREKRGSTIPRRDPTRAFFGRSIQDVNNNQMQTRMQTTTV